MVALLRQGSASDSRDGPRWKALSRHDLCDHAQHHLDPLRRDPARYDRDSGRREAAHLAVRGLMLVQWGIEHGPQREAAE